MRVLTAPDFSSLRDLTAEFLATNRPEGRPFDLDLVAPSELAVRELRQDLASRPPGWLGLRLHSWPRWVAALTPLDPAEERALSDAAFERLVARVVEDLGRRTAGRAGPLARARETPGISRALAGPLRELEQGGFEPEDLAGWRDAPETLKRELYWTFSAVARARAEGHLVDRCERERRAAHSIVATEAPLLLFGFHDFTPRQRLIVRAAAAARPVVLLVPGVAPLAEREPGEAAVAPLLDFARELGAGMESFSRTAAAAATLSDGLFELPRLAGAPDAMTTERFATEATEVRAVARRIRAAVRSGSAFSDFVLTTAPEGPAPALVRRVFANAGIPLEDRAGVPLEQTESGRRALRLVRATIPGAAPRDREAFDFTASPPDADAFGLAREHFRAQRGPEALVASFAALFAAAYGEPLAEEVARVLAQCELTLPPNATPAAFGLDLAALLAATTHRSPGDGAAVLLVARDAARFVRRPHAVHLGMVAGALTRARPEDPLLPDRLRHELNDVHGHTGRELSIMETRREERTLLARLTLESASERVWFTWSACARVGSEARNPSSLLDDVATAPEPPIASPAEDTRVAPAARVHAARVPAATLDPVDPLDLHLALFAEAEVIGEPEARLTLAHAPADLLNAWRAAELRRAPALGPHDGVLRDERARRLITDRLHKRVWSPSSLSRMATCPFSFLLYLLKLDEKPADPLDFTPLERGKIFHALLDDLTRELQRTERLPLTPTYLPEALTELDRLVALVDETEVAARPPTERSGRLATLQALRNDVALLLAREAWRPAGERAVPIASEIAFAPDDPEGAPTFPLPNGDAMPFRGRVDRLDETERQELVVVDFKTGRPRAKSHALRATHDGKVEVYLQAPLYLEAMAQRRGRPPSRAVLAHATLDAGYREVVFTAADLAAVRDELGELLAHLDATAKDGWFPCTPGRRCCQRDHELACGPAVVERTLAKDDERLRRHLAKVEGR